MIPRDDVTRLVGSDLMRPTIDLLTDVVAATLKSHPYRVSRDAAIRERFDFAWSTFKALVDKGWGFKRIRDNLATYVRLRLDGLPWDPDDRAVWCAGD